MENPVQILYLDDDASLVDVIKLHLEKEGITADIQCVGNRSDFESSLSMNDYDLIIFDRALENIDDFEAISIVRKISPFIPVIVLSGTLDEASIVEAMQLGANDYILKQNIARIGPAVRKTQLQNDMQANNDHYRRSLAFANIGTWDWNIQTGELYWSDRIAPLFGYPEGNLETTYDNFLNAVHPDDRENVIDAVNACIKSGAEYNIEHRCVWPDGTVRWLLEKGDVDRSEDGTPLNMLGVVQDITDRKLAREALAENTALLNEAQRIGRIGNWTLDISTGDLRWSDEIYRIFGYQPNEFEPSYDRFFNAVHPDDVDKIKQSEKEAFDHNKPHSIDHRIVLPDGEIRWVHEEAHTTYDENNKPVKLSGTVQDITDRKLDEEKLILTNKILHQIASGDDIDYILSSIVSGVDNLLVDALSTILIIDDDNKLHNRSDNHLPDFYNQAIDGLKIGKGEGSDGTSAFRNHRVIVENIFSHPYWENFTDLAKKANLAACWSEPIRSLSTKPFGILAIYFQHPRSPNLSELDVIYNAAQLVSIALLRELHESSLKRAKDDAVKANKAKSEFLSQMSHELRTPLNAIIGFSQLLELDDNLDDNQIDSVREIHNAGKHLHDLIDEILDLSLIESGNIEIDQQEVALLTIIDECINLTENLAKKRHVTIERQTHFPSENITVIADSRRLKQSILNLLSNAIKYNIENGTVFVNCTKADNNYIQINISDTGLGLSDSQLKKLFTPFNRFHTEKSDIEGTGIGLVITKQLVELMGGSIDFESEEGVGTTFSLMFKLANSNSTLPDNIDNQSKQHMESSILPGKTVIYIEDNPVNLKVVEQSIKKHSNIKLLSAMDPEQGIDLIIDSTPDLILLDINLPNMNGFEVLKILKENSATADIPVIALSANAMATDIEKAKQAGFDDYLTKPLNIAVFFDLLDKYLN